MGNFIDNKGRIRKENVVTTSFNDKYLAISRTISQQRPDCSTKLND